MVYHVILTPWQEGLYPIHLAVQKEESQDRTAEVDSVIQQGARVNQTIEQVGQVVSRVMITRLSALERVVSRTITQRVGVTAPEPGRSEKSFKIHSVFVSDLK